jgi:branched-chain amino acid transport system permease protein
MSVELASAIVGVLVLGSLYALVGVGFVVLFSATKVMNFAQGSFMLVGAHVFLSTITTYHLAWPVGILVAVVVMAAIGVLVYAAFFRRLVGAESFVLVIASLGLNITLLTVAIIIWGAGIKSVPKVISTDRLFSIGNFSMSSLDVAAILASLVIIGVLDLLLRRTRVGTQMRAVASSALLASNMRINVSRMSAIAWAVAALTAGVAGIIYSLRSTLDPVGISALGLVAFPAVFLGGLTSIRGAVVGGLLLALAQNATTYLVGGLWSNVVAYAILLLVLLVRPSGLFGRKEAVRL